MNTQVQLFFSQPHIEIPEDYPQNRCDSLKYNGEKSLVLVQKSYFWEKRQQN